MKKLFRKELYNDGALVFHTKIVSLDEVHATNTKSVCLEIEPFSYHDIKKNPFKYIFIYRQRIRNIKQLIRTELSKHSIQHKLSIIIGTDKDNFTQVLLNEVYKNKLIKTELIAIEEGTGFYRREYFIDSIKKLFYKVLTPLLFTETIEYHRQLGTDKRIDKLYARLPDLIPVHRNSFKIKYLKYSIERKDKQTGDFDKGILIYSFPNKNYPISDSQKKIILDDLIDVLGNKKTIFIKPHPRENLDVIKSLGNVVILSKNQSGEELNYFNYDKIINFSSSIVIDLLSSGYPRDRVFTINLDNSNLTFFKETNYIKITQIKALNFEN